jgi:hypothetical protein
MRLWRKGRTSPPTAPLVIGVRRPNDLDVAVDRQQRLALQIALLDQEEQG